MSGEMPDTPGGNVSVKSRGAILLVDENEAGLYYYHTILTAFGYEVKSCGSYAEAVRLLDPSTLSLIIISQGSSKFEGRWVLESARQLDPRLPVVVVAGRLDMRCYLEAMQLGAVDYLHEPITVQELGRAVETHVRARAADRERALGADKQERRAGTLGYQ